MNRQQSKPLKTYASKTISSPVGRLTLVASDAGLAAILWENDNPRRVPLESVLNEDSHPMLLRAEKQINEYFEGRRTSFDLELDFAGTTFQKKVWNALRHIPFGETRTYGEIAAELGNPNAVRAVGAANGRNPLSIVTPCHRVIGVSGHLTGFVGGLGAKEYLLRLERSLPSTGTRA